MGWIAGTGGGAARVLHAGEGQLLDGEGARHVIPTEAGEEGTILGHVDGLAGHLDGGSTRGGPLIQWKRNHQVAWAGACGWGLETGEGRGHRAPDAALPRVDMEGERLAEGNGHTL